VPELPEVETVREGLSAHVVGQVVVRAEVLGERAARRQPGGAAELEAGMAGSRLAAAVRRGKYLWLLLDPPGADGGAREGAAAAATRGGAALLVHLGMSGQLRVGGSAGGPHTRVRLHLDGGGLLTFVDQRTFGYTLLTTLVASPDGGPGGLGSPLPALPREVAHVARDVLDPLLAPGTPGRAALVARLRRRRTGIKRALLDQRTVSGIGNIYADEGLWRARLHGESATSALARRRVEEVLDAVAEVMRAALAAGGTSFDALYVNVNGASGYFDRSLAVYGQARRACPRCGAAVVREPFMNRSSYRCPRCQPAPRLRPPPAGRT
jgi:formamidopyrimidine-DNA glycosylase